MFRMILKKAMIKVLRKDDQKLGMEKMYRNCSKPTHWDLVKPRRGLKFWKAMTRPPRGR